MLGVPNLWGAFPTMQSTPWHLVSELGWPQVNEGSSTRPWNASPRARMPWCFRPICLADSKRAQKRCERKEGSPWAKLYYRSVGRHKELCFAIVSGGDALNVWDCLDTLGRTTIGLNVFGKLSFVRRVGGGCRPLFLLTTAPVFNWVSCRTQWVGLPLRRNRFIVCFWAVFCTLFVFSLICHVILV